MYHWAERATQNGSMHPKKRVLLILNIVGGAAVLGSYAWGLSTQPNAADALWGGVPQVLRRISTANMLAAALGYFAFTLFILFSLDANKTRVFGRFGYGVFNPLYAAILVPSALWMPITLATLASPGGLLVWVVRFILVIIGLASIGLLRALWGLEMRQPAWLHRLAVIGCVFFCLQTAVLDAVVWSAYFRP
jgi:hypothetical protein